MEPILSESQLRAWRNYANVPVLYDTAYEAATKVQNKDFGGLALGQKWRELFDGRAEVSRTPNDFKGEWNDVYWGSSEEIHFFLEITFY